MKLMTTELAAAFASRGSQENITDPIVVAKFFNPCGAGTWYATAYNPETRLFFGYVSIFGDYNDEWGAFSLDELEHIRLPFGLGIERDLYFSPKPISDILRREPNEGRQ